MHVLNAAGVYLLKVNCEYDRKSCGICSKLTVKTLKRSQLTLLRYHLALVRLRSSHLRCSIKKLFLKISQFSQESTCVRVSFLIKLHDFSPATLLERDSNTGAFL